MNEQKSFIVVPKPEKGWPSRVQEIDGYRYTALGGELYGPEEPTVYDLQQLYAYWVAEHTTPYDVQNEWVVDVGRNCARLIDTYAEPGSQKDSMLDLACGSGLVGCGVLDVLGDRAPSYIGVDITDAMLRRAYQKSELSDARLMLADVRRLPFAADTFDTVTGSLFINHITDATQREKAFKEVWRVMRPNALFILVDTPNNPASSEIGTEIERVFSTHIPLQYMHYSHNAPDGFLLNYYMALKPA